MIEITARSLAFAGPTSTAMMRIGELGLGASALGLGVLGLASGDFALVWQPVPADLPGRTALAYLTAGLFAVLGAGLLWSRRKVFFSAALAGAFLVWTLLLQGPEVVAAPLKVLPWLGFTERLSVVAGALVLFASQSTDAAFARWGTITGRIVFGACLPIFGLSHFAYAEFTAGMVPAWLPEPLFWAYLTGAGHVAAGISILTTVLAHLASVAFAAMVSSFVLIMLLPRVLTHLGDRREWTMMVVSITIVAAAWCVAASLRQPTARAGANR